MKILTITQEVGPNKGAYSIHQLAEGMNILTPYYEVRYMPAADIEANLHSFMNAGSFGTLAEAIGRATRLSEYAKMMREFEDDIGIVWRNVLHNKLIEVSCGTLNTRAFHEGHDEAIVHADKLVDKLLAMKETISTEMNQELLEEQPVKGKIAIGDINDVAP